MFYKWKYDKVVATVLYNADIPRYEFDKYWSVDLTNAYVDQLKPLSKNPNLVAYVSMVKHFNESNQHPAEVKNRIFDSIIRVSTHDEKVNHVDILRAIMTHRSAQ